VELFDIGFHDYCTDKAFCFIEWPDRAEKIIPEDFLKVTLQEQEDGSRLLSFAL
jgi:tRNA threonylcarbamoyladenosine biosynthesis protein TsaE